ncbi:MAG TPA: YciI family protein [Gaiellaceae bacterium]
MQFDRFTITLLILRPDAPELEAEAAAALQDAHMAHLADLHEAGHLLAAGPLDDEQLRGLSILNVDPARARELKEEDPAVRAGRFSVKVIPWMVPGGAMSFSRTRFPRSTAEVSASSPTGQSPSRQ